MNKFLRFLHSNRHYLTRQQVKTIRGQALSGNVEGAIKGFNKLLKNEGIRYE